MGPVESSLLHQIGEKGCIHLALIDPEKFDHNLPSLLHELEANGTAAVMIGGSTVRSTSQLDNTVKIVRRSSTLPTILFPNGPVGISRFAHAIFFMSLLNSSSPEYLIEAQVQGAPAVKRFNLEPIPLGYLVVGRARTTVSSVGRARLIPFSKPEIAANYALAAQYLGMRWVYLEAGSGAQKEVDPTMVAKVSTSVDVPVIVGGGIRTASQAKKLARAGAAAIVTGTILEREDMTKIREIVEAINVHD